MDTSINHYFSNSKSIPKKHKYSLLPDMATGYTNYLYSPFYLYF